MQRLAFLSIPLVLLSTPAVSADLDGPAYRPPARVVERERIIERRYYDPQPPAYVERRVYIEEPEVHYEPRVYTYDDRPHGYAHTHWRQRYFFPRHHWHRHRHHHHRHHW